MKHNGAYWLGLIGGAVLVTHAMGVTTPGNPYQNIVGRNSFGLKPPTPPPAAPAPPPAAATKIQLQGISTILGYKQVLLKIQPPPPGKEISTVVDEGQREGEVEVLEINSVAGLVRIKNSGVEQTLSMDNDAVKPVAGSAIPGVPVAIPQAGIPSIPPPTAYAAAAPPTVTTFGGAKTLPTRSVRSPGTAGAGTPGAGYGTGQSVAQQIPVPSLEEQTIMMEVQREVTKAAVQAGELPPLPPTDMTHLLSQPEN